MDDDDRVNVQLAPFPDELDDLVSKLRYRPGWEFQLVHLERDTDSNGQVVAEGLTLIITTEGYNSYHVDRGQTYRVNHYMPVPAATYDRRSWRRWLLEQLLLVEQHETCEFFTIDGEHPYAPSHGPGNNPYLIREVGTETDQRTSFRGVLNPT